MNRARRNEVAKLIDRIAAAKELIDGIREDLSAINDDEEEYRDNIPENLQGSERYEQADAACDSLAESVDALDEIDLDAIAESLQAAIDS